MAKPDWVVSNDPWLNALVRAGDRYVHDQCLKEVTMVVNDIPHLVDPRAEFQQACLLVLDGLRYALAPHGLADESL